MGLPYFLRDISPLDADGVPPVQDFLSSIHNAPDEGTHALEMLQQRYTIDYGSRKAGSRPTLSTDEHHSLFFLDMIIVVGSSDKTSD